MFMFVNLDIVIVINFLRKLRLVKYFCLWLLLLGDYFIDYIYILIILGR